MEKGDNNYGRAYAIMDLEASKEQIKFELPRARQAARTPSQLEITVREVKELMADRTADPDLIRCLGQNSIPLTVPRRYRDQMRNAKPKRLSDLKYIIEAKYPGATNERAAEEITDVAKNLYYAFGHGKPIYAEIIAKAPDGQYHPWEND